MTGVEAVSNGVHAFREPVVPAARRTLTVIIGILMVLLLGIAYLAHAYQIGATEPGTSKYQSVLSQSHHRGAAAGVGRTAMVPIFSPQPARPVACGRSAEEGAAQDRDRECALVSP
jgi:hypothetical protein